MTTDNPHSGDARALAVPAGRLSRLTRLGSMTAGIAGNMAVNGAAQLGRGQRPKMRDLLLTPSNMRRVADQLAKMRGAAMKIGQLVSMDTGDVLPPELAEVMARLRADAHFMPPAQLKTVLGRNWPENWLRDFHRFDVRPIAAASIGQVHRATLKDGRELAIKVQYPGIARSIDSDVANVGALMRMSGLIPAGFEIAPYLEEARKQLHEETDYALEGQHLTAFNALLESDPDFTLPTLVPEWTTPDILAMTFAQGQPIEAVVDAPKDERDRVAKLLIDLLLRELFSFGLMQTDPNFANYRYDAQSGRIVLLDFGATRRIAPAVSALYRDMIRAGFADNVEALDESAARLGLFDDSTKPAHREQIVAMMRAVFAALTADERLDFTDTTLSRKMQEQGQFLAEDGYVPPPLPMDVLYLQRKFGGIFLLAARLRAHVPVRAMIERYLDQPSCDQATDQVETA